MPHSPPILLGCRKRTRANGAMYVNAVWKPTTHTTRWSKHLTTITVPWVDDIHFKLRPCSALGNLRHDKSGYLPVHCKTETWSARDPFCGWQPAVGPRGNRRDS